MTTTTPTTTPLAKWWNQQNSSTRPLPKRCSLHLFPQLPPGAPSGGLRQPLGALRRAALGGGRHHGGGGGPSPAGALGRWIWGCALGVWLWMCPVKGCECVEHRSSADFGLVSCGFDFDVYFKKNGSKTVAFLGVNNLTCYMHICMYGMGLYSILSAGFTCVLSSYTFWIFFG